MIKYLVITNDGKQFEQDGASPIDVAFKVLGTYVTPCRKVNAEITIKNQGDGKVKYFKVMK